MCSTIELFRPVLVGTISESAKQLGLGLSVAVTFYSKVGGTCCEVRKVEVALRTDLEPPELRSTLSSHALPPQAIDVRKSTFPLVWSIPWVPFQID